MFKSCEKLLYRPDKTLILKEVFRYKHSKGLMYDQ